MCGIAGVVETSGRSVERSVVEAMTATLVHRGPDGGGVVLPAPGVGFGHRRLSILDLEGGAQPMANAAGDVVVTFNGEIFNFRELRDELARDGRVFVTRSDTEVLLAAYERFGVDVVHRLRGQFAFAIHDRRKGHEERVLLARDRLGIKPLYWSFDDGRLLFASEPRALLAHPNAPRDVDPVGVHLFLRYRFVAAPWTFWRGVQKLGPGERLVLERGGVRVERWHVHERAGCESVDDDDAARAELLARLQSAVERQAVADVPVGAFLSGGVDSSTTAALLARHLGAGVRTYTIGFESKAHDEREFAKAVADHLGTVHTERVMAGAEAGDVARDVLAHLDEPFGDPSLLPTWVLCRAAAIDAKVVLSGDGSDELFGGYGRTYRALSVLGRPAFLRPFHRVLNRVVRATRDPSRWRGDDPRVDAEWVRLLEDVSAREARGLYGPALRPALELRRAQDPLWCAAERYRAFPPFSRLLLAELDTHLADYHLTKVDRASMAHGLEVRVPFLDEDVVAAAFRWSARVRLSGGRTKGLLRDAMAPFLPAITMTRPKRGFGPPLSQWFGGDLGAFARRELLGGAAVERGFLERRALQGMLAEGKELPGSRVWRLLVLEMALRR